MHAETFILAFILPDGRMIAYKEMCLYQSYMFVQHCAAARHSQYSDPGFIFSTVLN